MRVRTLVLAVLLGALAQAGCGSRGEASPQQAGGPGAGPQAAGQPAGAPADSPLVPPPLPPTTRSPAAESARVADRPAPSGTAAGTPAAPAPDGNVPTAGAVASAGSGLARVPGFSHVPHRNVACRTCHTSLPGHVMHGTTNCTDCHTPPGAAGAPVLHAPADCRACHHSTERVRACSLCHGSGPEGTLAVRLTLRLSVWPAPRERTLPFDHARHTPSLPCTTCHTTAPDYAFARSCGDCHASHHRAEATCSTCHPAPPASAHGARAHEGCGGAGCHADPPKLLEVSRTGCLVCHTDRTQHEAGKVCASCHLLRAPPAARPEATRGAS